MRSAMPRTWDVEVLVAISPDDPPHCLLGKVSCGGDFEQWAEIPTTDIVRAYRMFPLFVACLKHGTSFEEAATLAYAGSIYPFPSRISPSQELLYRLWEVLGSEQLTRLTSVLPQISWVETQVRAVLGVGI
ncbi:MAG: hypothetical protein H6765_06325 [Candidatus Peribacteria bacterium]|nr:MAG: hypothetical protein H6765_06325 [Candidatus Peribacteria bacterium]